MRPLRHASLLSLALVFGCDGGPSGPEPVVLLSVSQGSVPVEEITLTPDTTLQLTARPLSAGRKELADRRVRWSSTAPQVAAVNDSTGLVTTHQVGTARVIATSEGVADTVRINVAQPVTGGAPTCPADAHSLRVGEVRTFDAFETVVLCLAGAGEGEPAAEYTLVPFNSFSSSVARMRVQFAATGTVPAAGPPNPWLGDAGFEPTPTSTFPVLDDWFHQRLNDGVQRRFARPPIPRAASDPRFNLAPGTPSLDRVPAVGEELHINVRSTGTEGCSDPDRRTGRVVAVTSRAVVVADTANPKNGFTQEEYRSFAMDFDTLVWKVATENFGEPSDIDGNGRVVIFFTRAVNELTPRNASSYVGGFFYNRDLFSRSGDNPCEGSNEREMFYMVVPDPTGEINGNTRTTHFVRTTTVSVLAHEFQHLINDSRRLHKNKAPVWEERWLNEGLSHVAEELVFYRVTGLQPEMNLTTADLDTPARRSSFSRFGLENVQRLIEYLERPEGETTLGEDRLATRGAAWAFLRYAADRKTEPAGQRQLWYDLVNSRTQGLDNLREALAVDPSEWLRDWTVALYTDDAVPGVDPRFVQPSWNFRQLIPGLASLGVSTSYNPRYPLRTIPLGSTTRRVELQGGGAAYFRFAVPSGGRAAIRTTVNDLPAPSRLKLSVVRTR